jgi:hypothetical protein
MDWRIFLVCIAIINSVILFVDWFIPELRTRIWKAVGRCWLYIDSLDAAAIPTAVARLFAQLTDRIFGPRYMSARALLGTSIWTVLLLYFLSVTIGLFSFDDVRAAYKAVNEFRRQIELQSAGLPYIPSPHEYPSFAQQHKDYFLLLRMEPIWYLVLLLTTCVLCNVASMTLTRALSARLARARHLGTCFASMAICLNTYFVLTGVLFVVLHFRPSLAKIDYHTQVATSVFWVRSVLPLVSIVPLTLFTLAIVVLILKLFTSPIRWFAERLLRRLLESDKGVLSVVCGGMTAILALVNFVLRFVGATMTGK